MQTQHCKIYNILHVLENFHDVRLSLSSLLVNFRFLFCSHHITSHQLECRLSGFVYIHVLFWLKFKIYKLSFLLLFILSLHHIVVEINLLLLLLLLLPSMFLIIKYTGTTTIVCRYLVERFNRYKNICYLTHLPPRMSTFWL